MQDKNGISFLLGEPSGPRLLTALTVVDSHITTLPHTEDLRLELRNDVGIEFTIQIQNNVLVLSGTLNFS